jgi:hypothetical protein
VKMKCWFGLMKNNYFKIILFFFNLILSKA